MPESEEPIVYEESYTFNADGIDKKLGADVNNTTQG
jgi:hypothetical protein